MAFIAHDVDYEMHLFGISAQTRGDGVKPRLQFREQPNKFFRAKFYGRMLIQEIDRFHAPEVSIEILFALRIEQLTEQWRGGSALRDRLQEFRRRLGDGVIAQKRLA